MKQKIFFKNHLASIINHTFQIILITYLVFLLIEQIWPGLISVYLNLNYLLIFVIIIGILDLFSEHTPVQENIKKSDYIFVFVLGILAFIIIKFKTIELEVISWVISSIAAILVILLGVLILQDEN